MRLPRVRLTVRGMMIAVAVAGMMLAYWVRSHRSVKAERHASMARWHEGMRVMHGRRRTRVLQNLTTCLLYAASGVTAPSCLGRNTMGFDAEHRHRESVIEAYHRGYRGGNDIHTHIWATEALWWAAEVGRDLRRCWWHERRRGDHLRAMSTPSLFLPEEFDYYPPW